MQGHIADLLAFVRRGERRCERVDVRGAVESVVGLLRPISLTRKVRLTTDLAPEIGAVVADPGELERALLAVIENGLEAVPEGGEVRVRAKPGEGEVLVTIEDDGPGMDPDLAGDALDGLEGTTRAGGGLGLGIARRAVESFGGRMAIGSRRGGGRGTTVEIRIPR